jgi:molybdopterin-guanine dinucleotide biosynthesis protein B
MAPGVCYIERMRIIGLAGWSGAGKTTLLAKVIPILVARGLKVSTIKHAHHGFDVDVPGKDSHTHRERGASEVLVASSRRWALIHELRGEEEPDLPALLAMMNPVDLVVVEGFKRHSHPKLEVYRAEVGKPLLHPDDPLIVAVATDGALPQARVPAIALDDAEGITDLLMAEAIAVERLARERVA